MKYKIEQSTEIINSCGGISLVGKSLEAINFRKSINNNVSGTVLLKTRTADVMTSWIGLLCQGRTDYEDINLFKDDLLFGTSFNLNHIYSSARFR